jgi:large repetitive protein
MIRLPQPAKRMNHWARRYTTGSDRVASPVVRRKISRTAGLLSLPALGLVIAQIVVAAPPSASFTMNGSTAGSITVNVGQPVALVSTSTDADNDIVSQEWDFDYDGNFSADATGPEASRPSSQTGSFSVALRVTDGAGDPNAGGDGIEDVRLSVKTVNVLMPNQNPTATDITFTSQPPNNGNLPYVGQTIAMSGSGSDPDGDPVTYEWNFGDGGTATGQSVTHAYSSRGAKSVTLTVRDNRGGTASRGETVTVNALPVADAHVVNADAEAGQRIDTPLVGQQYAFTSGPAPGVAGSGSSDAEGGGLAFAWDLDDDGTFETPGANAASTAALQTAGMKSVRLRVTDSNQATSEERLTFRVNSAPVPGFGWEPPTPAVGKPIQFFSTSSDPDGNAVDPLTYSWDLDNDNTFGETSPNEQGQNPAPISFATAGLKRVRLRVTDTGGITREIARDVLVQLSVPNGGFRVSSGSPLPGEPVTFTSTSTPSEASKQITNVEWDFDYNRATGAFTPDAAGASVTHAFPSAGEKSVAIRVTEGPAGGFDIEPGTVVVNAPPRASFTVAPSNPFAGDSTTISSTSMDPDGPLVAQDWDLDADGQFDDASGPVVSARYLKPGRHEIRLRVTDSKGAVATASGAVDVQKRPLLLLPDVVIDINGSVAGAFTTVKLLRVRAPKGTKVLVMCKGKGCPKKVSKRGKGRALRFKAFERRFKAGTKLIVRTTKPGFIGRQATFVMRSGKRPKRVDRCMFPGATTARKCPAP